MLPERRPTAVQNALAQVVAAGHAANAQVFQRDAIILRIIAVYT